MSPQGPAFAFAAACLDDRENAEWRIDSQTSKISSRSAAGNTPLAATEMLAAATKLVGTAGIEVAEKVVPATKREHRRA